MKTKLLVLLCAGALSASALAQNPAERQRNQLPTVKDGTSVTLPPVEGCTQITDNAYNGTQASMVCLAVPAPNVAGQAILDANVQVGVAHTWVGDLTMKVFPPGGGAAVTVVSRPGFAEPADDGNGCCGTNADLLSTNPITFDDQGGFPSAETLGTPTTPVPASSYTPNNGAAPAGNLGAFAGLPANGGNFMVCVGDSAAGDVGNLCDAQMTFTTGVAADLSIVKTAPSGVTTSGLFPFNLAVANAGPGAHPGATVTDTLPAGIEFFGSSCGATAVGQTVTWNVGALAAGASANCQLYVRQAVAGCGLVSNTATVVSTDPTIIDPPGNNSSTFANGTPAVQLLGDPGFETGSPNASWAEASSNFGSPLCTLAGCGAGGGTGPQSGTWWSWFGGISGVVETGSVQQSVVIPAGTATINFGFEAPVCQNTNGANDFIRLTIGGTEVWRRDASSPVCDVVGYQNQSIDISAFATGASQVVRFESTTSGVGGVTNFFIDNVTLNSVGAPICTAPLPADVAVTLTDSPDPVVAGTALTYTVTVTNNGLNFATDTTFSLPLPAGTAFASATPSAGGTCNAASPVVCTWAGDTLPGASRTATVVANVSPAQTAGLSATVTASSTTADNDLTNNTATQATAVQVQSDVSITLTDAPDPVIAGTQLTYTAVVANAGPSDATGVSTSMAVPANTSFVSGTVSGGGSCAGSPVVCTVTGSIAPGASRTVTMVMLVAASAPDGSTINATATVSSASPDPNLGNNSASTTTGVIARADLVLDFTASVAQTLVNVPVTFTATSRNDGPSDAQNVSVTIALTPDFRYSSHSATGATCTVPQVGNTGSIVCTWAGATAPGVTRTLTVVAFSNVEGPTAVNASTASPTTDPNINNNSASLTIQVGYIFEEIPTLGNLGLLLMGLVLALGGLVAVRRQG